jgi:hypothetical protein
MSGVKSIFLLPVVSYNEHGTSAAVGGFLQASFVTNSNTITQEREVVNSSTSLGEPYK